MSGRLKHLNKYFDFFLDLVFFRLAKFWDLLYLLYLVLKTRLVRLVYQMSRRLIHSSISVFTLKPQPLTIENPRKNKIQTSSAVLVAFSLIFFKAQFICETFLSHILIKYCKGNFFLFNCPTSAQAVFTFCHLKLTDIRKSLLYLMRRLMILTIYLNSILETDDEKYCKFS